MEMSLTLVSLICRYRAVFRSHFFFFFFLVLALPNLDIAVKHGAVSIPTAWNCWIFIKYPRLRLGTCFTPYIAASWSFT
jgi:hypothetical protein